MAGDYKQSDIAGTAWHRFSSIVISNPHTGVPKVTCAEEEVISLATGKVYRDVAGLTFPFDPAESFPILNPLTNEPTGATATGLDTHVLVYSYVLHEAKKRDEAAAAQSGGTTPA